MNELTTNTFESGMTNLTIHEEDKKGTTEWSDYTYDYDYDYDDTYESDDENRYRGRQGINRRYIPDEEIEASKHWHSPALRKMLDESFRKSKLPKPKQQGPKEWGWKGVGVWGCPDNTKTVQEPQQPQSGWRK